MVCKVEVLSEDLELVLWDVARPGRLNFDPRGDHSHPWLCFATDDDFLADGGTLETSFCSWGLYRWWCDNR